MCGAPTDAHRVLWERSSREELRVGPPETSAPNNRAENSHQPTRVREKVMRRFKSAQHLQRFALTHDQVANLFMHSRYYRDAAVKRTARSQAFAAWGGARPVAPGRSASRSCDVGRCGVGGLFSTSPQQVDSALTRAGAFRFHVVDLWRQTLRRRSQRDHMT